MRTSAAGSSAEAGFTLVELMVVLAILAVASAAVIVNLPDPRGELRAEAERLAARTAAVRDAAIVEGRSTALRIGPSGYGFVRRERGAWIAIDQRPLREQPWGEGVSAVTDGPAQVSFDSTGLASPAAVTLMRDAARATVRVGADGSIDVE